MVALLYIVGFVAVAILGTVILWTIWPPLAGAAVGLLLWREFFR